MKEGVETLTERERETLRLLLVGHDIKSISARLGLSVHTVNERLREARRKLGASSSRQAARILAQSQGPDPDFADPADPHFSGDRRSGVAAPAAAAESPRPRDQAQGGGRSLVWLGAGVLVMVSILAVVFLSSALQGAAAPAPAPSAASAEAPTPAAIPRDSADAVVLAAAEAWVELLDKRQWGESWEGAGALFKAQVSQAAWRSQVQALRMAMGRVSSREIQSLTRATSLPGAPDGDYAVLRFATDFAQKRGAVETVVLAREPAGWKTVGYFIK